MKMFSYRAIPMDLLQKPPGVIRSIWERALRFFRLRRRPVADMRLWVEQMDGNIEEGVIQAESGEHAALELVSRERLYPIEIVAVENLHKNYVSRLRYNLKNVKRLIDEEKTSW